VGEAKAQNIIIIWQQPEQQQATKRKSDQGRQYSDAVETDVVCDCWEL